MQDMIKTRLGLKLQNFDLISKSSLADRLKYNTLQQKYIQRGEKGFDMCPEVLADQSEAIGYIYNNVLNYKKKDPTIKETLE